MMLPTEEAIWVGEELTRRFGVPRWLFTLSATDANRTALRLARQITRPAEGPRLQLLLPRLGRRGLRRRARAASRSPREGNVGAPGRRRRRRRSRSSSTTSTRSSGARRPSEIAVVLAEPAMTNMGIILPGRRATSTALRELTRRARHAADHRRDPHVLRRPRRLHAGVGPGARHPRHRQGDRRRRAVRRARADRGARRAACSPQPDADYEDTGGVGGTLAGNALSSAAMRATLEHTLHADAFSQMIPLATRFAEGVQERHRRPRRAVERHAARLPRRVPVPARAGAQRHGRRTPRTTTTSSTTSTSTR